MADRCSCYLQTNVIELRQNYWFCYVCGTISLRWKLRQNTGGLVSSITHSVFCGGNQSLDSECRILNSTALIYRLFNRIRKQSSKFEKFGLKNISIKYPDKWLSKLSKLLFKIINTVELKPSETLKLLSLYEFMEDDLLAVSAVLYYTEDRVFLTKNFRLRKRF